MDQSKEGFLPVLQGVRLSTTQSALTAEDREKMSVVPYASAIGSIMYAMLCTRPDVNLAVCLVGRYQSNPGMEHWTAGKNILKYLKRTKEPRFHNKTRHIKRRFNSIRVNVQD